MKYIPEDVKSKNQDFIDWLEGIARDLNNKDENPNVKLLFPNSENGDVATAKDLVGNFLAILKNEEVEIK